MRILFVDQISFSSLRSILAFGRSVETIWHFDPLSSSARRMLRVLCRLGLIRAEVRPIEHHIGQVRNDAGESEYVKLRINARAICDKIKREHLAHNPLIKAMGAQWATNKLVFYFDKLAEQEVSIECLRIGLVRWMLRTQLQIVPAQSALLMERKQWFSYLEEHARSQGIRLIAYGNFWGLKEVANAGYQLFLILRKALPILLGIIQSRLRHQSAVRSPNSPSQPMPKKPPVTSAMAIRYWHRKLSFDPTERSEFFWLHGTGIPYSEILVYDYMADQPLDAETLQQINARGIRLLGRGPGIAGWIPTWRMFAVLLRPVLKLTLSWLVCLARGQWVSFYAVRKLLVLAMDYAYSYDFYSANRVLVHVGTHNTRVGQVLASVIGRWG